MTTVELLPNAVKVDSGGIATFPATGTKYDKVNDNDNNTYIYASSGSPVIGFQFDFTTYTLGANERCAGCRLVNRKSQNYPGSSQLVAGIGGIAGTNENAAGTMFETDCAGPWNLTELNQTQINALYSICDFNATSANILLQRQTIQLDIRSNIVTVITSPANATAVDPTTATVNWGTNNATQKKYRVRVFTAAVVTGGGFNPASSTSIFDTGVVTSSTGSRLLGGLSAGTEYYAYVLTYGDFLGADWVASTWAGWHFTTNFPPTATVTAPTGTVTNSSFPTITWTYADTEGEAQTAYEARIYMQADIPGNTFTGFDPDTTTVTPRYASGVVVGIGSSQVPTSPLLNSNNYRAYVRVRQGGTTQSWGPWAFSAFTLSLTQPNAPTLGLTATNSNTDKVNITITPPGSTPVAISYYVLERSLDNVTWETRRLFTAGNVRDDSDNITHTGSAIALIDYEVPLHRTVYYRVVSVSLSLGTPVSSVFATGNTLLDHNRVWIKDPLNPTRNNSFPVEDGWLEISHRRVRTPLEPLSRTKPVILRGTQKGDTFTVSVILLTRAVYDAFMVLVDSDTTFYIQSTKQSWYCELSGDVTESDHLWDDLHGEAEVWKASMPLIEVKEP
jgi:hypothetical protein